MFKRIFPVLIVVFFYSLSYPQESIAPGSIQQMIQQLPPGKIPPELMQRIKEKGIKIEKPEKKEVTKVPVETKRPKEAGKVLSLFEKYLKAKGPLEVSKKLKPFGYEFFAKAPISKPVAALPVTPDYVVGPGDELQITIWGRINAQYKLTVSREGTIFIPNVGLIGVAGLTYQQMKNMLEKRIQSIVGANANVTIESLRSITVFVTGEVKKPGAYVLTPMHTVIDALLVSGGPTKIGSLRKIILRRGRKKTIRIDLYSLLLYGEKPKDIRLMHGDVVYVPTVGPLVGVAGNVKRPAVYELKDEKTLDDVIKLAGGLLPVSWSQKIQVERFEKNKWKVVLDINATNRSILKRFLLKDGDLVKVFSVLPEEKNAIYLGGNVKRPGKYAYYPGMRVKDVIGSVEDLLPDSFMKYALIKRFNPERNTYEYKIFSLEKLLLENSTDDNLELKPMDTIVVLNKWDVEGKKKVHISGAVNKPGDYDIFPGMRVSHLIKLAGGLKRYAYREGELTRKIPKEEGTEIKIIKLDVFKALSGDPKHDIPLCEDDYLVIRAVPRWSKMEYVDIKGEVVFPGRYAIRKGEKLSSLIERAGGFTKYAYLKGAIFTRKSVQKMQQKHLQEAIERLEKELLSASLGVTKVASGAEEIKYQSEVLRRQRELLAKFKAAKAIGRVVIKLYPPKILKYTAYDLTLEDGDVLIVPRKPSTVNIMGAVYAPNAYLYEKGRDVGYYIKLAGGLSENANKKGIFVVKADGSVVSASQRKVFLGWTLKLVPGEFNVGIFSYKLEPGDTIVVPEKIKFIPWLRIAKDITTILYQMAIAVVAVSSL